MADPTTISGLVARFRASDLALSDGDPVATWVNTGSGALNATQATSSRRPLYKTNIFGSQPALLFDKVDDYLRTTSPITTAASYTLFMVYKDASTYSGYGTHIVTGDSGGTGFITNNTGSVKRQVYHRSVAVLDDGVYTASTAEVWCASRTSTGPVNTFYVNGTSTTITNSTSGQNSATTATTIGAEGSGFGNLSGGYIAEILMYDSQLSSTDRATVHTYVQDTYGITVSDYVSSGTTSTIAWTEADDTWAVGATETITATAAWTEEDDTVAAAAAEALTSSAAWTEDDDAWVVAAAEAIVASSSWTDDDDTWVVAAANASPVSSTIAWTEENDSWLVSVSGPQAARYFFVPPLRTRGHVSDATTGLVLEESYGMTVINSGGSFRLVEQPQQTDLMAADAYYLGGHRTEITAAEKAALEAAGYGSGVETVTS